MGCHYCGKSYTLRNMYLDFDERNNSGENVVIVCEKCEKEYLVKRANEAVKILQELGFKSNISGEWVYDNYKVRNELTNVQALEFDNKRLQQEILTLQAKLKNLVYHGYDKPIVLKDNEWLLDWNIKREFHCPECGSRLDWNKRNGKYESKCESCNNIYVTKIDRLIVRKLI